MIKSYINLYLLSENTTFTHFLHSYSTFLWLVRGMIHFGRRHSSFPGFSEALQNPVGCFTSVTMFGLVITKTPTAAIQFLNNIFTLMWLPGGEGDKKQRENVSLKCFKGASGRFHTSDLQACTLQTMAASH